MRDFKTKRRNFNEIGELGCFSQSGNHTIKDKLHLLLRTEIEIIQKYKGVHMYHMRYRVSFWSG